MSFFFPSFWDDQDDFFEPYTTLYQFLGNLNDQRIEQQKAQQQQQRRCYQKPHKDEEPEASQVFEDDGSMSDGEVVEEHQKRHEEEEEEKEENEQEAKKIAEEAERLKKEMVLVPSADVVENDTHFIITMNMPGLKKEDIHVSLEKGFLTVSAERPQPCADATKVIRREIPFGKMERKFEVPEGTKPENIFASVKDGVLTLTIKKPVAQAPRKIEIA